MRLWLPGYRRRYHKQVVSELEYAISSNRLQPDLRKKLAYFARDKWRPQFLHENECAKIIQRRFRYCRSVWRFQGPLRQQYMVAATAIMRKFWKAPYSRDVRAEMRRIAGHRMCSRKHPIHAAMPRLALQEAAKRTIYRAYRAYSYRAAIYGKVMKVRRLKFLATGRAARVVQSVVRMFIATRFVRRLRRFELRKVEAAVVVQKFVRRRQKSFRYCVYRVMRRVVERKKKTKLFLSRRLTKLFRKFKKNKVLRFSLKCAAKKIQRMARSW